MGASARAATQEPHSTLMSPVGLCPAMLPRCSRHRGIGGPPIPHHGLGQPANQEGVAARLRKPLAIHNHVTGPGRLIAPAMQQAKQPFGTRLQLLRRSRWMPGSTPPTTQLDWLISTTAMIVLSWSRATRDLLKSFGWGIRALHQLDAATMVTSPRRLTHPHLTAGRRSIRTSSTRAPCDGTEPRICRCLPP